MSGDSRIALVITDQETNAQIKKLGVGLLELRADLLRKKDPSYVIKQIKLRLALKIPLLLTVRNQKKEGAVNTFSDGIKWKIIQAGLPLADMVDIELSSSLLKPTLGLAKKLRKKTVVSSHFLKNTPKDLEAIFRKSLSVRPDIVKIAAKANSMDDVISMLVFTFRHRKQPLITMSLGEKGSISRLVLPVVGSRYTYTFLHKPKAPGQIDVLSVKKHLGH